MRLLILMDSFKGSLSSMEAAHAITCGVHRCCACDVDAFPVADGGEGTVNAVYEAVGGQRITMDATYPDGTTKKATYLMLDGHTALIEFAAASGLTLCQTHDVLNATSRGTGELILDAVNRGAEQLYIGLGGSATNDCGIGLLHALGARFLDAHGDALYPSAQALFQLEQIDLSGFDSRIPELQITVMCDVSNPLCGENGATAVYGPQKGVSESLYPKLDAAIARFAKRTSQITQTDLSNTPGTGAAGGAGFALLSYCRAQLCSGIDTLLQLLNFNDIAKNYDLILTGEGRMDAQSRNGKVPVGIARAAARHGVPVAAIAGALADGYAELYEEGFCAIVPCVCRPMPLDEAMKNAHALAAQAAESVMRAFLANRSKNRP